MTGHALTAYGYATVALAARSEPEYEHPEPDDDLPPEPEPAEDREPPHVAPEVGEYGSCPDWPHRGVCDYCGGNGCRQCGGTGEREDRSPCRHP